MLRSNLCSCSDAYSVVKWITIVKGGNNTVKTIKKQQ